MAIKNTLRNKKVLVTCGPTWVPIDNTRVISNVSSGRLGQLIATGLVKAKAKVTLLEGQVEKPQTVRSIKICKFTFYDDFSKLVKKEIKKKYDIVVHAAAVADYQLKKPFKTKISSQRKSLRLDLVPAEKIIQLIKKIDKNVFLVGFKLVPKITEKIAKERSRTLFDNALCDIVVANSTDNDHYEGFILNNDSKVLAHKKTRKDISTSLIQILKERL